MEIEKQFSCCQGPRDIKRGVSHKLIQEAYTATHSALSYQTSGKLAVFLKNYQAQRIHINIPHLLEKSLIRETLYKKGDYVETPCVI